MKRTLYTLFFHFATTAVICLRCSVTNVGGGGTIETTNGIVGSVCNSDSTPAVNTIIKLFPDDYDPVAGGTLDDDSIDTTDADGTYRFENIIPGSYTLLAYNRETATSLLRKNTTVEDDSVTTVPMGILSCFGAIAANFSSSEVTAGGYMYIPGTDIFSPIDIDGSAFLAEVPPVTLTTIILASGDNEKRNILRNEITVTGGDTAIIELPQWNYSRRLVLNTTPTGADVSEDVYDFPVLIRLDSGNFDFSQTRPDGKDLVFTGNGNTVLPCEIERWDGEAERAEVWVKVDTIRGNNDAQSITMYWGNATAGDSSARAAVFDTADGFQGVWHLGDAENDSIHDATVNRYHGISPDTARPQVAEGVVGNCRVFDGVTDYITMPNTADSKLNFPEEVYYTLCAWVSLDTFDNEPHLIVAKGFTQYHLRFTYFPSNSPVWEFVEFSESSRWKACTTSATSRQWTLLTGVREGSRQLLYCNGVLVDSTPNSYPNNNYSRDMSNDLSIGKFLPAVDVQGVVDSSDGFFKGSIDEVRVLNAAQSPDWVRLCYMNQRAEDRLVVFKE